MRCSKSTLLIGRVLGWIVLGKCGNRINSTGKMRRITISSNAYLHYQSTRIRKLTFLSRIISVHSLIIVHIVRLLIRR